LIPDEIIHRKKQGFPVPMKQWLQNDLNVLARDVLLDDRSRKRGYFNFTYIEQMMDRHASGEDDLTVNIWNLLVLELWHRIFIDADSTMRHDSGETRREHAVGIPVMPGVLA
jgi:asparagine synthase (glutamine-hydrolysing)